VDIAPPRRDGAGRRLRRISSRVGSVTAELARAFLSMLRTVAIQADMGVSAARAENPGEELDTGERRISLRVKVPVGDGTAVVEMTGPAAPENGLQALGDRVLAAVEQHADGAVEAARLMVAALRDRGWEGDDILAGQLDALLGGGAMPDLRPLPVDLDELAGILEGDPVYGGGRVDLVTGEVWPAPAVDYARETGQEDEDESDDPDEWLWVHCEGSRDGYRDMELFIGVVRDPGSAGRLEIAISGRGAFRRFKDVLGRWPGELDRWYAFSAERQRGRARAWLADAGYYVRKGRVRRGPRPGRIGGRAASR